MSVFRRLMGNKYRELVIAVSFFVLIDASIMALNFYVTTQLDSDAHAISVVTRQQTLAEEILKGLYAVYVDSSKPDSPYQKAIDNLASPFRQFDETLDSMIYGGELIGTGQGADKLFKHTNYLEMNRQSLEATNAIWQEYRTLLSPIANADFNGYSRKEVIERTEKAVTFAKARHPEMSGILLEMAKKIEDTTRHKVQTIRKVQIAGIVLAVANFILILFHFIRKINRSDEAAQKAEHETREILNSVSDGLFLLDRQLRIGDQHSVSLERILPCESFSQRNFLDVMRAFVTEKTLTTAAEYIALLFTEHVEESLINDLNPLQEVTIHIDNKDGSFSVRHLQFAFRRTWNMNQLSHVLVSVTDITEAVELRKALKKSEMKSEEDMAMLTAILHLDPSALSDFLDTSKETLEQINQIFSQPGRNAQALQAKLHKTQRLAHKLKGDCSLIDLRFLIERVHVFENHLKLLQEKEGLGGDDFVGVTVELDRLMRDIGTVHTLTSRISKFAKQEDKQTESTPDESRWESQLRKMSKSIAIDEGKQVQIQWSGYQTEDIPGSLRAAIQDVIVQCTRNAICHGIETTEERITLGKPETGTVQISLLKEQNHIRLYVKDDGSGINLKQIRERALESRIIPAENPGELDSVRLVSMIFHPHFSTARKHSLHAGRGVGLSLVRDIVKTNSGSISIKHRAGAFTEFAFLFPMETGKRLSA
ncbi:MAG TPA: ATP-binding protein [Pseudomonadales bacterium]|nr:ATP-binding protein [Pseudomonadales bacterium]